MKRPAEGHIHERITAIATPDYPAYVVCGETKTLMIDSGVNHLGPLYLADIRRMFGEGDGPDYLFLTHSHYDHVGSADYLKKRVPGLRLGAHERVAALAQKQSALETMNRLSNTHDELLRYNPTGEDVTLHPFEIDILLAQGSQVDLGGLTCNVYEVPGHTRDSLAFFFPETGTLFPGDACGVLRTGPGNPLQVEFVASFQDYVDSLRLMIDLRPQMVCLAHNWVLTGVEATAFLERSLDQTFDYRQMIESYLDDAAGDVERTVQNMARAEYGANGLALEPSPAQMTNLIAQVKHIAEVRGRTNDEVSRRACREQAAYDSSRVHEHSARLQSRFAHIFGGPNSLAAESFFAGRLTAWAPGADILDYGCYAGELEEILIPLLPRSVTGIDISSKAIGQARQKRRPLSEYYVMDASRTTFPDNSFDFVVGRAILHHLDFETSLREVHRLLRPGGHALFVEPLRGNPVARVIRALTPLARTSDETPLTRSQVRLGDDLFGSGEHFFANLVSVPAGVISSLLARTPDNPAMRAADRADRALARTPLRYWMRLVVLAWELRN